MGDSKSPASKPAVPRKISTNPNTLDMVVEAITSLNDRKGASVPAIKSYILDKYPTVDPNMLRHRLKKGIEKGMSDDLIIRPKSSDQAGSSLSGRFRINKTRMAALEKAKLPKPKPKPSADKPKVKKPKVLEKTKKSPKKTDKAKETKKGTGVKKTKDVKTKIVKPKIVKPTTKTKSPAKSKDMKTKVKKTDKVNKTIKTPKKTAPKKK